MAASWRRLMERAAAGLVLALVLSLPTRSATAGEVTVFAAASLKNALDAVNEAWKEETGQRAAISYAGSPALARQIEAGAPAEVFISADRAWMDCLEDQEMIVPETRRDLLGNRIVLISTAAAETPHDIEIAPGLDLAAILGDGRLAVAETDAVPAGRYAKAALQDLGLWEAVSARLAEAENVRMALFLVSRGEAPLGIVYRSDALADSRVRVLDVFPEDRHPPIVYPAALTKEAQESPRAVAAAEFLAFLTGEAARAVFEAQGFTVMDAAQ